MKPKLSSLTPTDKIKLAAELDGWYINERRGYFSKGGELRRLDYPDLAFQYSTSYDAIIPLIQSLSKLKFIKFVSILLPSEDAIFDDIHTLTKARKIYFATPSQLLDALLVATGKAEI